MIRLEPAGLNRAHPVRPHQIQNNNSGGATIMMRKANRYHRHSRVWSHIAFHSMNCISCTNDNDD
jgi:hypothetical protein